MENQKRILTGDNATGRLHLGHYVGSLKNRVELQDEYKAFIIVADMHAFAYPKYVERPDIIAASVLEVTMDNLAVGLDPKKATFFTESSVPEIYELSTIFSMLATHNRVLRNPTLKDEIRDKNMGDNYSLGFINFPLLQVADILSVHADLVPVGEDQLPHLELTNEIARRFNSIYGETLKEIKPLIGEVRRLVGVDGNAKMTKSLNNAIYLSDTGEELKDKVTKMFTDPNRLHATDFGKVEGNPVFMYHDAFNPNKAEIEDLKDRYKKGQVGDVEVKEKLFKALDEFLSPIREKRNYYENNKDEVMDILREGARTVRIEAKQTLDDVKSKMKLHNF